MKLPHQMSAQETPTKADEELGLSCHFDSLRHNHLHSEKNSSLESILE